MIRRRWFVVLPAGLFLLTLLLGGVFLRDVVASGKNIYDELYLFNEVLNLVSTFYVEDVQPDSLIEGAITGMLDRLDPHSNYMDPKRFQEMEERNRGSYSGIGVSFQIREGNLTVISPIQGGPSFTLGIRSGDVITKIEGESAFGIKEKEVFEKLRGPKGTKVHVTVRRVGEPQPLEFEIVRDDVPIQSVPYHFMLAPGIGYVMMHNFSARTAEELTAALEELKGEGMRELIFDLRGNSGGYLNAAVDVSDLFLGEGKKIVYTKGRVPGSTEEYFSEDHAAQYDIPLLVLIDAGSASASEIVAGAVQDWDRGLVAGHTSFGKGLVQRQYRLRNDGALLLTVARYYTPSGRLIQRPYLPGDRLDYYRQAGQEDTTATEPQPSTRTETPADTTGRPVFHTLLQGRDVYGGGGITPDVRIHEIYRTSRLNQDLIMGRKYFDYANDLRDEQKIAWPGSFDDFYRNFTPSAEMLDGFKTFLEGEKFVFSPDSLQLHLNEVRRGITAEIARNLWGESERYRILLRDDPAMSRAVELLPQAESMLTEAHRIEAEASARSERAGAAARSTPGGTNPPAGSPQ
jgi:carboxyl-terminal processing protease